MTIRNSCSLLLRNALAPFGVRLVRLKANKVRGIDPLLDLKWLVRNKESPVIFDVGANDGETASEMLKHFPSAKLFAFEPFEQCYRILKNSFADNPDVRVENIALGDVVEDRTLNLYSGNRMNSLLVLDDRPENIMKDKFPEVGKIQVQVTTLDKFCRENHILEIDILKVDTQGFDLHVLRGGGVMLRERKIKAILLELNFIPMYKGQSGFLEIHEFLTSCGYRLVDMYNQERTGDFIGWCDGCYVVGDGDGFVS